MILGGILNILKKRSQLFLYGDRNGVSVSHLAKTTNGIFLNVESLITVETELPKEMLDYLSESEILFKETIKKKNQIKPSKWNVEQQLFTLLYSLVRAKKPNLIIETGVANGVSTNAIMRALGKVQKSGVLHSFDILPETHKAYKGPGNWQFHLLNSGRAHIQLSKEIQSLARPDIWLHDSNHGYRWQKFEYSLAMHFLKEGGVLVSDDVEASPAWAELASTLFRRSYIIFDSRKFIGIAFK